MHKIFTKIGSGDEMFMNKKLNILPRPGLPKGNFTNTEE